MGYGDKGPWRFGAALSVANTTVSAVGSIGDQVLTPTGLDAALADHRVSGNITQLRLTGGVQYQVSPEILLGALVRTPGLRLFRSGEFGFDSVATAGDTTASLAFFDPQPTFDYKLPFQATAGAAWVCNRFQLELDVSFFSGTSAYDLFTSEKTATSIFDNGQGGPPAVDFWRSSSRRNRPQPDGRSDLAHRDGDPLYLPRLKDEGPGASPPGPDLVRRGLSRSRRRVRPSCRRPGSPTSRCRRAAACRKPSSRP
jgi:hypothetical protein